MMCPKYYVPKGHMVQTIKNLRNECKILGPFSSFTYYQWRFCFTESIMFKIIHLKHLFDPSKSHNLSLCHPKYITGYHQFVFKLVMRTHTIYICFRHPALGYPEFHHFWKVSIKEVY